MAEKFAETPEGEKRRKKAEARRPLLQKLGFRRSSEAFHSDSKAQGRLYHSIELQYRQALHEWHVRRDLEAQAQRRFPRRLLGIFGTTFNTKPKPKEFMPIEEFIQTQCSRIIEVSDAATGKGNRRDLQLLEDMGLTIDSARELLEQMRAELDFSSISAMVKSAESIGDHTRRSSRRTKKK